MQTTVLQIVLLAAFGAIAVAGALGVIIARKVVYSALSLLANFASLGVMYIILNAEFLGIVQLIVYAGAIVVLFLFALMFVGANVAVPEKLFRPATKAVPIVLGLLLIAEMAYVALSSGITGATGAITPERIGATGSIEILGQALFTTYMLPFELASVLLLVGIIGAVVLAKSRQQAH